MTLSLNSNMPFGKNTTSSNTAKLSRSLIVFKFNLFLGLLKVLLYLVNIQNVAYLVHHSAFNNTLILKYVY